MIRNIHLHGALGKKFGRLFQLDVLNTAEAARALCTIVPGFKEYFREGFYKVIRGNKKTGFAIGEEEVTMNLGKGDLHFIPVVRGSGRRGLGKILAGVFLIGAAFFFPGAFAGLGGIGITTANVTGLGFSLLLGGLGQLLAPKPKTPEEKDDSSYLFNGGPNITTEGGPVPLVYGFKVRTNPVIIGSGIAVEDVRL